MVETPPAFYPHCVALTLRQKPMDDLIPDFIIETAEGLQELDGDLLALAQQPGDAGLLASAFRHLHTIKGNCGFVHFSRLQIMAHHAENLVACFRDEGLSITPARVGLLLEAIDRMRVILAFITAHHAEPEGADDDLIARLDKACAGHDPHTSDLPPARFIHTPPSYNKAGLQPISKAWARLPYIVRSLSAELDKKIDLVMTGEDTELDARMLDLIKAPLTHMIRNSGDHGIERPSERLKAGKPETGTIRVHAARRNDYILLEIADDGQGLNLDLIRATILTKNLASPAEVAEMSANEIQQFIFNAGFSTASSISSISGRGVGMDVVRSHIEDLGGTIELVSTAGQGATFNIKIPCTNGDYAQVKS